MTRLLDGAFSKGFETIRLLISDGGFTEELAEKIREKGGVKCAINALLKEFFPVEVVAIQSPVVPSQPKRWRDMGDYIILPFVVDRVSTGPEWIERTDAKGNRSSPYAKNVLGSKKFKTTSEGVYEVAVLKGSSFASNPTTKQVRAWGKEKKFSDPNSDIACYIRDQYSDDELKEMGLWWIAVMHEPIVSGGFPGLLGVDRHDGGRWLNAYNDDPHNEWNRDGGFAFLVPQISSFHKKTAFVRLF